MILAIWIIMLIMGIAFLIIGQVMYADIFRILGVTILFLAALPMLNGSIEYTDGSIVTASGDDYIIQDTYDSYGNHTIGFLMAIISAFAFVLIMVERRREADET